MITVELLAPSREADYGRFLLLDPRSLIYASLEFRDFLRAALPGEALYLVARDGDRITGVLPCFRAAHPRLGSVLNSLPWYGSHGGCTLAPGADPSVRTRLLDRYVELAREPGTLSATLILSPFEQAHLQTYLERIAPAATDRRTGQITELPPGGSELEGRLERGLAQKTRNLARKSLKQGFTLDIADTDAHWRLLHATHVENMLAVGGRAKPWEHFAALRGALPAAWRSVSVALLGDEPVAALLLLYFNRTVEYVTPVVKHDYRPLQPLSFLIWNGMLDAVRRGMQWWNWGGTWLSQRSLHHFKSGWGAQDHPYTYLISASPEGIATLGAHRDRLVEAFPNYYTFPYHLLETAHAD